MAKTDSRKHPLMRCAECRATLNEDKTKYGKWWCPKCRTYREGEGPDSLRGLLNF